MTPAPSRPAASSVPPWRDERTLRVAVQVAVLVGVAILAAFLVRNFLTATTERGLGFGFGFLGRTAGFDISESPIPYAATDTYGKAFLVGVLNTLFVSVVGIVLATVLGILVGVARLSPNWLLSHIAATYVEVIRNTPLLVQLFILYFAVFLQLPSVAQTISLPGAIYLNQRGVFIPAPQPATGFGTFLAFILLGMLALVVAFVVAGRREADGHPVPRLRRYALAALVLFALIGWFISGGAPFTVDLPVRERFNFTGGLGLSPEFTALLVGLVLYTAAFIGEVVRGGIQAVRHGQLEAARALGLSEGDTLRLVVFPQALRVIVPPLTSQYLNLAKNSSLAIAIGYPDLFKVGQTMANQTGQPLPVIILVMSTYLAISLVTSGLMNLYNRHVQVLDR